MAKAPQGKGSGPQSSKTVENELTRASVLLFDARHYARRQARIALNTLGFWTIVDTHEIHKVPELLDDQRFELVVAGIAECDDGVADLVRNIRRQAFGKDPFVPIILTAWSPPTELVTTAINSGADDLLIWPFSINQLRGRIAGLIRTRKRFVITDAYLGPDRRFGAGRSEKFETVEVPNALKARVEEDNSLDASDSAVRAAMERLQSEKIRSEARRINQLAESVLEMYGAGRGGGSTSYVVSLIKLAEQFQQSIAGSTFSHLAELALSVENVAKAMRSDGESGGLRNLRLLEKAARALQVAADMDDSVVDTAHGISTEIAKIGDRRSTG